MNHYLSQLFAILLLSICTAPLQFVNEQQPDRPDSQILTDWNELLLQVAAEHDGFLTLRGVRSASMMHLAIHDALNAIYQEYNPFSREVSDASADPVAAISEAAFTVAIAQYPDREPDFRRLYDRWMSGESAGPNTIAGKKLGSETASAVMSKREADGWDSEASYTWHPMAPGVYAEFKEHSGTPEGFVFGSGWAEAVPFVLPSPDHFRSPPPPEIVSHEYTAAYNEVKDVGSFQSITRSVDQTHLALWWKDFAENSHNRLARDLVKKEMLDVVEAARLFALVNMAIFDAYVSVFDNKFHFNHWRPFTAIRWAENDGNKDTVQDELWTNLHNHTYAFPSYPSAHGTACASAMSMFADVLGDKYGFTMRNPLVDRAGPFSGKIRTNPPTRTFESFSSAAMECSLSRVYLGIHFRYDSVEGYNLGTHIGNYVLDNVLTPIQTTDRKGSN